jgi:predicted protein tyrosine phosphatase
MKISRNRLSNVGNKFQGDRKRVLCVCSAGLLRSPTAAWVLSNEPFGFNTRAVGSAEEYALIPLDAAHVAWADEFVVMDTFQEHAVKVLMADLDDNAVGFQRADNSEKPIHVLTIEDDYSFRDPELVEIMTNKFKGIFNV